MIVNVKLIVQFLCLMFNQKIINFNDWTECNPDWIFQVYQQNGYDCGVFVCWAIEQLSRGCSNVNILESNLSRKMIASELLNGELFFEAESVCAVEETPLEPTIPKIPSSIGIDEHGNEVVNDSFNNDEDFNFNSAEKVPQSFQQSKGSSSGESLKVADPDINNELESVEEGKLGELDCKAVKIYCNEAKKIWFFDSSQSQRQSSKCGKNNIIRSELQTLRSPDTPTLFIIRKHFELIIHRSNGKCLMAEESWTKERKFVSAMSDVNKSDDTTFLDFADFLFAPFHPNPFSVPHFMLFVMDIKQKTFFLYDPYGNPKKPPIDSNIQYRDTKVTEKAIENLKANISDKILKETGQIHEWSEWKREKPANLVMPLNFSMSLSGICVCQFAEQFSRDGGTFIARQIECIEAELSEVKKEDNNKRKTLIDETNDEPVMKTTKIVEQHIENDLCGLQAWMNSLSAITACDTPKGLKVELLQHQKEGLPWMISRENGLPNGGILADDMGLGKTLSVISLVLQQKHNRNEKEEFKKNIVSTMKTTFKGLELTAAFSTLIVTPASVVHQWEKEIKAKVANGNLKVYVYHGPSRTNDPKKLIKYDIVLTTYNIISTEVGEDKIGWERIVLDEAHSIKNKNSAMSKGCCQLYSLKHWAVTGTPIQNGMNDFHALVKFLSFCELSQEQQWKQFVTENDSQRLGILVKAIVLRRMKTEISKLTNKPLVSLKKRNFELVDVIFDEIEKNCYNSMFGKAQTFVKELMNGKRKLNKSVGSGNEMMQCCLVILLRLRQSCVHFAITQKITETDPLDNDDETDFPNEISLGNEIFKSDSNEFIEAFDPLYVSAKLKALLDRLTKAIDAGDKCVVVSQWTSLLDIIEMHLKNLKYDTTSITGKVATKDRQMRMDSFNQKGNGAQIMLLSLNAGGTGLNLIGGNHLFLMDLHWNPALEKQAFDRIYRIGQEKNVFIYKFICKDTIEKEVLELQEKKTKLADAVLEGKVTSSLKFTMSEMKFLMKLDMGAK
uniref:Transcription termination factor 2 n=1 Tax=Panagrolaimus sp. ES5 TaxID=591445 RepID=A0AC34FU91_9BILA